MLLTVHLKISSQAMLDNIFVLAWFFFFFSSRRRHTRYWRDWSSDVCSSDLLTDAGHPAVVGGRRGEPDAHRLAGLVVGAGGLTATAAPAAGGLGGVARAAGDQDAGAENGERGRRDTTEGALPRCRHVLSSGIASLAVVGQVVGRAGGAGPGRVPPRTASGAVGRRAGRGAAGAAGCRAA